ncbi:hypothetical protein EMPS_05210 [Entomortierella parvispora]|uniref:FAD-binding domain-containing protein n=1 Tax=Entomortierella parvispora TaxID=205924 RepID=A0A9P3HA12_9FUNG|nr:hypothetical protein EMPS_05210 [Entomortierella parvispora]
MPACKFKVIIVGGGVSGLAMGVMLERASIDYLILEAADQIRPLGGVLSLQPSVMRAMEQLGLLEDLLRQSNVMTGVTLLDHKLNQICELNVDYARERYGYDALTIVRPKLFDIFLSRIPAYKILFGKSVVSTAQNKDGVKVRCKDGSTYSGDIIVAADGAESPIREAFYEEIRRRSLDGKVPYPSDYERPKLEQRCVVGVTQPLSLKQFPVLESKNCQLQLIMPRDRNCMIWVVPMSENRIGWSVTAPLPKPKNSGFSGNGDLKSGLQKMRGQDFSDIESRGNGRHESGIESFGTEDYSTISYSSPPSTTSSGLHASYESESIGYGSNSLNTRVNMDYLNEGLQSITLASNDRPRFDRNSSSSSKDDHIIKKRKSLGILSKSSSAASVTSSASSESRSTFERYPIFLQPDDDSTEHLTVQPSDRIWNQMDPKYSIDEDIRSQPCPFGGNFGDMVDATSKNMVAMVVVEEKFYHTWHFGRTILIGDACHKLLPSSGHGTTQAVLDVISLVSLLVDLPSNSTTDIDALFRLHFQRRGSEAKSAVHRSKDQDQLLFNRNLSGRIIRKMASNWIANRIKIRLGDSILERRPMLHFLKPIPDRGYHPNKDKTVPLLQDKRFESARRKSVSSGYIRTGKNGDREDGTTDHVVFDSSMFSNSTPSILLPPAFDTLSSSSSLHHPVPALPRSSRPMSSLMDIEGTLVPNMTRRSEIHHLDQPYMDSRHTKTGHWHMYDQ